MIEELGEVARAHSHETLGKGLDLGKKLTMTSQDELVQLAAVCLRALDDWERNGDPYAG